MKLKGGLCPFPVKLSPLGSANIGTENKPHGQGRVDNSFAVKTVECPECVWWKQSLDENGQKREKYQAEEGCIC